MKVNHRGQAVGGRTTPHIAGTPVRAFVGRVAGSPQGCWWGDRVLCQVEIDGKWCLAAAHPDDATFEKVADHGQHRLYGNGRIWVCFAEDGYRDSLGGHSAHIAPVGLDDVSDLVAVRVIDTNDLAVVDARTGIITTVESGGPDRWEDPDIDYRGGVLVYRKGGVLKAWPEKPFAPIPAAGIRHAGQYLLEYQEGRGVICRHRFATTGIVVMGPNVLAFGADMHVQDSGTLLVVSSSGSLEMPHEFRYHVINPATWTVNGHRAEVIDLSRLPSDAPPPPVVPPPVPPITEPEPMPEIANRFDVVRAVDQRFPHLLEIARRDGEDYRGAFVDQVAHTLNRIDRTDKWGRKARQRGVPASANGDTLTYRLDDNDTSKKKMVDIVAGDRFEPSWNLIPVEEEANNGYWIAPINPDLLIGQPPEPVPTPIPTPSPTPVPVPTPCHLTPDVRAQLEASQAAILETLQRLAAAIDQLAERPPHVPQFPDYRFRVLGQTVTARPVTD